MIGVVVLQFVAVVRALQQRLMPFQSVSGDGDGDGLFFSALVHSLRGNVRNQYDDQNSQHPSDLDSYPSGLKITGISAIPVRSGRLRT